MLTILATFWTNHAYADVNVGMIGYWKFDERSGSAALDSSGLNNNLSLSNILWSAGKVGAGSSTFGGAYGSFGQTSTSMPIPTAVSLSFWTKASGATVRGGIVSWNDRAFCTWGAVETNKVNCTVTGSSSGSSVTTSVLNDGVWHHIVFTATSLSQQLFVDGVRVRTNSQSMTSSTGPFAVGSFLYGSGGFAGSVDDLRIYNRVLTSAEVNTLFGLGSETATPPASTYPLTVVKSGTGTGTVTGGTISCGSICSASVTAGSAIALSAVADKGSSFSSWSGGGCSGTGGCTVSLSSNTTITAAFVDVAPPTVSVASPSAGSTVSGTTTIAATASDNIRVASVQFFLDGSPLGAASTASPWQTSWDSKTTSDGSHTLTAVAKDAAGNSAASAQVVVSVQNTATSQDCSAANIRCVDDTPGATQEYATIQACADAAVPGDTCLIYPGFYDEYVRTSAGGTSDTARITFKALSGSQTGKAWERYQKATVQGFVIRHPFITIEGLDITKYSGARGYAASIDIYPPGNNCVIQGNTIRDATYVVRNDLTFSDTGTIYSPTGGFVAAGFRPGALVRAYAVEANNLASSNTGYKTVTAVTDTVLTLASGANLTNQTVIGPVYLHIPVHGIQSTTVSGASASSCVIRGNKFSNLAGHNILFQDAAYFRIENNLFERTNGWDVLQPFGHDHVISGNIVRNSPILPGVGNHPDVFQVFGDNGTEKAYNILFDRNFVIDFDGQLGQINSKSAAGVPSTVIHHIKFTNNVFANISMSTNVGTPYVSFINNTFYNMTRNTAHPLGFWESSQSTAPYAVVQNNVFVGNGALPDTYGARGWYTFDTLPLATSTLDYNFVSGPATAYESKRTFVEPHGINGGNPSLSDINNLLGPDGEPFTADDGLRPLAGSVLCARGLNGTYIGAYSCSQ